MLRSNRAFNSVVHWKECYSWKFWRHLLIDPFRICNFLGLSWECTAYKIGSSSLPFWFTRFPLAFLTHNSILLSFALENFLKKVLPDESKSKKECNFKETGLNLKRLLTMEAQQNQPLQWSSRSIWWSHFCKYFCCSLYLSYPKDRPFLPSKMFPSLSMAILYLELPDCQAAKALIHQILWERGSV